MGAGRGWQEGKGSAVCLYSIQGSFAHALRAYVYLRVANICGICFPIVVDILTNLEDIRPVPDVRLA